jgi:DNA-directed RNA polymerase subunit RPC12/RpoP
VIPKFVWCYRCWKQMDFVDMTESWPAHYKCEACGSTLPVHNDRVISVHDYVAVMNRITALEIERDAQVWTQGGET